MTFFRFFLLFVFLIPLSQTASSAGLALLTVASLILPQRIPALVGWVKNSWDMLLFFLMLGIGLSYSEDKTSGWSTLETSLSLITVPLVMTRLGEFGPRQLQQVFLAFTAGLIVALCICLSYAGYRLGHGGGTPVFFFYNLTGVIDFQPTYVAYYLIASITFGFYLLYYEKPAVSIKWIAATLIFLFGALLLTGGITAFVSVLYVFAFFMLKYLLEAKSRIQTVTFVLVCLMVAGMFTFNELRHIDPTGFSLDDSWERLDLWEAALQACANPLLGVGTGDGEAVLNAYYAGHGMAQYASSNLNPHNQFISVYLSNGLLGLISFLLLLFRPLYLSVKRSNALGALIFFPFIIYGMTEVFLGRYQGVIFFALLRQSFILFYQGFTPTFSLKRA
ncbi:MAG: O-antigen ligase family protein [Cyclobacteriaceae bacterium]|nr:O-antigen ligase family protein [Cyclobacteriaceae bacterium]